MKFFDRLLTIIITATVTSAIWIVAGSSLMDLASSESQRDVARPAEAVPSPSPTNPAPEPSAQAAANDNALSLDNDAASAPERGTEANLVVPVLNVRPSDLTDTFAKANGADGRLHEALDIMAPVGTTVIAAGPGTVEKLFEAGAGGKTVYVRSEDGRTIHYYAHLSAYAEGLREGQRIRRGQRIGEVGVSGNAERDAPHLHFAILRTTRDAEWWEPANAINPYPLLTAAR